MLRKAIRPDDHAPGREGREDASGTGADGLAGKRVFLVSRCAWTLFNFRRGLIESLLERGNRVAAGGAADDGFGPQVEALGVRFVPLPVSRRTTSPIDDLRLLRALYVWYRRESPDVVHHFTIKPVIYGSIAARLARVPRIVNTVTGLGHAFMREGGWLRRLVENLYRIALACSHRTFFQNPDDRRLFVERGLIQEAKAELVRGSGVDLRRFHPSCSPERDAGRRCRFLFMGRLLREKGVYELMEAARMVKQSHPALELLVLGIRDERNPSVVPLEQVREWKSESCATWLERVTDVRSVLGAADVVVLPSYREGTPRSLLEAAAMGKPLIATNVPGCREVVEHDRTGLLVPARDSAALADAMIRLIDDPGLRRRLGAAGRKKMAREFDERDVVETFLQSYGPHGRTPAPSASVRNSTP